MDVADGTVLTIAHLYPELLGTYGDGGNALVLSSRARRRGVSVEVQEVSLDDPLPDADIYLLGGGEDGPQRQATYALAKDRAPEVQVQLALTLAQHRAVPQALGVLATLAQQASTPLARDVATQFLSRRDPAKGESSIVFLRTL